MDSKRKNEDGNQVPEAFTSRIVMSGWESITNVYFREKINNNSGIYTWSHRIGVVLKDFSERLVWPRRIS